MVRLQIFRAERECARDAAVFVAVLDRLHVREETQTRRAEERHTRVAREPHDLTRIGVARGKWLVDEDALFGLEDRTYLVQMRTTIHGLQQHCIHCFAQRFDRINELDSPRVLELGGEPVDPRAALVHVGTAALEGGDHACARHVIRVLLVVKQPDEGRHMRRVGADDADPDFRRFERPQVPPPIAARQPMRSTRQGASSWRRYLRGLIADGYSGFRFRVARGFSRASAARLKASATSF
jgi:hypothetical protein